jgi:hypothetical protein
MTFAMTEARAHRRRGVGRTGARRRNVAFGFALGVLALLLAAPASAACVVRGSSVTLNRIRVQPRGRPSFLVDLDDNVDASDALFVSAKPSSTSTRTELEVDGTIGFTGSRDNIWYSVREDFTVEAGLTRVEHGSYLVRARAHGDALLGSIALDSGGAPPEAGVTPELVVGPVLVPCSNLTLDAVRNDAPLSSGGDETWWRPRSHARQVGLRASPESGARKIFLSRLGTSRDALSLERVEERGGWLRLAYAGENALVGGWVRRSEWAEASEGFDHSTDWNALPTPQEPTHYAEPPRYQGPAEVALGTPIFSEPGHGQWAIVKRSKGFIVSDDGSDWIEIGAPGVSGDQLGAYVRRSAVQFPRKP